MYHFNYKIETDGVELYELISQSVSREVSLNVDNLTNAS